MLVSLLLAASSAQAAPPAAGVPARTTEAAVPVAAPPRAPNRPLPTGSTQPYAPSSRPSLGFISAASLRDRCEATELGLVTYCFAYIAGVHDTVRAYETWLRFREFCPPIASSQADMRRAFVTYLKAHPDAASGEAASVIVLAFKDQFPCEEATKAAPRP